MELRNMMYHECVAVDVYQSCNCLLLYLLIDARAADIVSG